MRALLRAAASFVFGIVFAPASFGAPAAAPLAVASTDTSAIPFDPTITRGVLDNGLTYFIRANPKPEARADLRLVVKAGSIDEDDDQRGLAHFVEHMLFNGTEKYAGNEIIDYLESIGARFGADLNAYTSFDETVYMLHVPTDREGLLDRGVEILAEYAAHATFDSTEIEKERGVVLDEWRRGRGASARIRDEQLPIVLRGSRYAERLPIGLPEILEHAPRQALRRFYDERYRPERMAVVAVGDFDAVAVERAIREKFGALPKSSSLRERAANDLPATADTAFALSDDPEMTRTSVAIGWKRASEENPTLAGFREDLVRQMAAGMLNDRLAERARESDPPFLGAGLGVDTFGERTELVELGARVQEGGEAKGLEGAIVELRRALLHGFLESEVDRTRRDFLAGIDAAYAEREKTDSGARVEELTRHFLHDEPVPGIERERELWHAMIPGITAEECTRALRELGDGAGTTVTVTRPTREKMIGEDELRRMLRIVAAASPAPYVDRIDGTALLTNPRPAGRATKVGELPTIGVSEWRLSNGVRFYLKPTDFQDDEILFTGASLGGLSVASDADLLSAQAALSIVGESGFGGHSMIDLGKLLAGKVASSRPFFQERTHGVSGSSTVADLSTALELAVLVMTAPNEDPAAFGRVLDRLKADLTNRDADPGVKYLDRLVSINTSDAPRRRPMTLTRIGEIDQDRALAFYRDSFENAADFTFFFVGNLDESKLVPEIERTLGSLPSTGEKNAAFVVREAPFPKKNVKEIVHAGVEPKSQTAITMRSYDGDDPDEWHRLRSATSILERRLRERLREALGATYGVSVDYDRAIVGPDEGKIRIRYGSDPLDAERLGEEALAIAEDLRKGGPTEEEVTTEKTLQRREMESLLKRNDFWMSTLVGLEQRGRPLVEALDRQTRIEALDRASLEKTAREGLKQEPRTWVGWAPEE